MFLAYSSLASYVYRIIMSPYHYVLRHSGTPVYAVPPGLLIASGIRIYCIPLLSASAYRLQISTHIRSKVETLQ
jgi:hypothetical protein